MADGGKTAKKRVKKDPLLAARTTAKNRAKRVARDQRNKTHKATTATKRAQLRRKGALARIERRIKAAGTPAIEVLSAIKAKIERSLKTA